MALVRERTTIPLSIANDIIKFKKIVKYKTINLNLSIMSI